VTPHPLVERYLTRLEAAIAGLVPEDRRDILHEIRNHIAEAMAAGQPLDAVLEALGPADALGRAYAIELLLHPQHDTGRSGAQRWFSIIGAIVVLSIPTLVAVSTLGSIGVSFVAAGLFAFIIGILDAVGAFPCVHGLSDLPPTVAIMAAPALVGVGLLALAALRFYVRFVASTVRRALPQLRPAGA
jgi:uncharacterized membrane protein